MFMSLYSSQEKQRRLHHERVHGLRHTEADVLKPSAVTDVVVYVAAASAANDDE